MNLMFQTDALFANHLSVYKQVGYFQTKRAYGHLIVFVNCLQKFL
jgi:hypothetical protein